MGKNSRYHFHMAKKGPDVMRTWNLRLGEQNMLDTDLEQELFSIREVAKMFSVSKMTIIRWIKSGELPIVRIGLGHPRIEREAINRMIEANRKTIGATE